MDKLRKNSKYMISLELNQKFEQKLAYVQEKVQEDLKLTKKDIRERGIKQGRKEGEQRGERQKALSIAKSMREKNYPIADIIMMTGLSSSEIKGLV